MSTDEEFEALREAAGMDRREFCDKIDERLRGQLPRLPRRDRSLRALVARYGFPPVMLAAVEVVRECAA